MKCHCARLALVAIAIVSLSTWVRPSLGAPTVFFARDAAIGAPVNSQAKFNHFTTGLASFGVNNIESAAGFNPTLTFGSTGITAATNGVLAQAAPGFVIGLQGLLELDAVGFGQIDTSFTFNQHITAFGVFVTQGGDGANNNPTTFRLTDTSASTFVDVPIQVGPGWNPTNVFFLGVADTVPFDKVTIIESVDFNDGMLYDNVVAGFVPEPSTFVLGGLGLVVLSQVVRQRKRD